MSRQTENQHGIRIKMCCASCIYKSYDMGGKDICMKGNGHVSKDAYCSHWKINDRIDNIRLDTEKGNVKRPEWLSYLLEKVREEEKKSKAAGVKFKGLEKATLQTLRYQWELTHGSVYM